MGDEVIQASLLLRDNRRDVLHLAFAYTALYGHDLLDVPTALLDARLAELRAALAQS